MSRPEPTFSIVIPTYNEERDIGNCLDCVLAQEVGDFEVIVVDGASTDGTVEVVNAYTDSRVSVIVEGSRRGVSHARNVGAARATGEIISFLNADVLPEPDWLSRLARHYDDGADFVVCVNRAVNDRRVLAAYVQALEEFNYGHRDDLVWSEGWSCRREAFDAVGGYEEFPAASAGEDALLGSKLDARFRRVLDRGISVPHIAPGDWRTFTRLRYERGKGVAEYETARFGLPGAILKSLLFNTLQVLAPLALAPWIGWWALLVSGAVLAFHGRNWVRFLLKGARMYPRFALPFVFVHLANTLQWARGYISNTLKRRRELRGRASGR